MNAAAKRKRAKVGRFDPKLMQDLRAQMEQHPNPMFGRMIAEGRMSDSDVLDFSLNVASAYFSGDLLEPVAKAAGLELERMTRQDVVTHCGPVRHGRRALTRTGARYSSLYGPDEDPDRANLRNPGASRYRKERQGSYGCI